MAFMPVSITVQFFGKNKQKKNKNKYCISETHLAVKIERSNIEIAYEEAGLKQMCAEYQYDTKFTQKHLCNVWIWGRK